MILSINHKMEEWRKSVDKEIERHVKKLNTLLKHYEPDLVQLHASMDKRTRNPLYMFTLNLSLPTGTIHTVGEGSDALASVKVAFGQIESQVKKHVALLRKDYEWKRKRPRGRAAADAFRIG